MTAALLAAQIGVKNVGAPSTSVGFANDVDQFGTAARIAAK